MEKLANKTDSRKFIAAGHQSQLKPSLPASSAHHQPLKSPQRLDPQSTTLARGKRLKVARMMAGLTRSKLEQKYGISASTIQAWETAKAGGLTERGVTRVLSILRQEGIACKAEWLLYGIDSGPQFVGLLTARPDPLTKNPPASDENLLIQELLVFRSLHPDAVDMIVHDDGMEPVFSPGDCVAGMRRCKQAIDQMIGFNCIVQTADSRMLVRRLKVGDHPGVYNLLCINPDTTVSRTTLYNQQLLSAATVVWRRKRAVPERLKELCTD